MDLRTLARVVRQNRRLLLVGVLIGLVLAVLAYATPGFEDGRPTIKPRGQEKWQSTTTLFITQNGFPWGRAVTLYRPSVPEAGIPAVPVGDQDRLSTLAALYAQLAGSDVVRQFAQRNGPLKAVIVSEPVTYQAAQFSYPQVLPLVRVTAITNTPKGARAAATRISEAFRGYVQRRQKLAKIPSNDRVIVDVARRPGKAELVSGRSTTLSALVFFAVAFIVSGIALVRDNLRRTARLERENYEARLQSVGEELPARTISPDVSSGASVGVGRRTGI